MAPQERQGPRTTPRIRLVLLSALVGLIALLPRVWGLADFLTTDEAYHWIARVGRFAAAVEDRRWLGTSQTGHPGVTIMWLGSIGTWLERWAMAQGWTAPASEIAHLAWLRWPHAVLEALLIVVAYGLLRRLLHPTTALLAALLWATSPFLIAHARLLHLDSLLTTFLTLALLCLLVALQETRSRGMLAISSLFMGLALLTKGPALILLPFAGLLIFALFYQQRDDFQGWRVRVVGALIAAVQLYLIWLGLALLVVVLLWPALWADAPRTIANYVDEIVTNGGRPNGDGQFFLGQAVGDPGPWFYLVSNLFRATPVMLIGLLLLPVAWLQQRLGSPNERRVLLVLLLFVLFWTLIMTLGAKKFDRYVLPSWPALLILAAAGWAGLLRGVSERLSRVPRWAYGLLALLLAVECGQLVWYQPYYLSYYNPLLGGGAAAQRSLLIGWGEGMDQVGAALEARPDLSDGVVFSPLGATLQPFVSVSVRGMDVFGKAGGNYAVVYLESIQRGADQAAYDVIRQTVPLQRITIHGIDYAEIYQLPKPFEQAVDAQFGSALYLRGITLRREAGQLIVTPSWDVREQPPANYHLFLHLLDAQGQKVAQVDVSPGGGDALPTSSWQAGQQIAVPLNLSLPADLPSGRYQLVLGLYDETTGERLTVTGGTAADSALAGPNALLLTLIDEP